MGTSSKQNAIKSQTALRLWAFLHCQPKADNMALRPTLKMVSANLVLIWKDILFVLC